MLNRVMFLAALLLFPAVCAAAQEADARSELRADVARALAAKDFEKLEAMASDYRGSEARFGSGVWKLTFFYLAISDVADMRIKDSSYWSRLKDVTSEWMRKHPVSPTARVAHAVVLDNYAWSARGVGTANTVEKSAWKPFYERLEVAGRFIEQNEEVSSKDPHWYVMRIRLATAQQWELSKFEEILEQALRNHPLYYQIYFAAVDYYSPKWGGDGSQVDRFARLAVERTKHAEGHSMYARVFWASMQYWPSRELWSAAKWDDFKKGIDDVIARYPDDWNLQHFAMFSCMADDKQTTAQLFGRITAPPLLAAWRSQENFHRCKSWASGGARRGP